MIRFLPRPAEALTAELKAEAGYKAVQNEIAEAVADEVRLIAPRNAGDYADSIEAKGGSIGSTDIAGHIIEYGSINDPTFAPIRRAVNNLGLRLDEEPKPS